MKKIIRVTTVPQSLRGLLKGQLHLLKAQGYKVLGVSSPGEALEDVAKNEKVDVYPIRMTREITPIYDILALVRLVKLFKKEKPDIVHTHTPKAGLLGMLAAKIVGIPLRLHTVAGMPLTVATGNKRKLLNVVEKITYKCATNVYPNSYGLKDLILKFNFTRKDKLKVIGKGSSNGVDTLEFDPMQFSEEAKYRLRTSLGIKSSDFVFLFVGRIVGDKGVNELVKAFDHLSKAKDCVHLLIVGLYEKRLDPLLPETELILENHPNIHTVGYKTNVADYFSIADTLTFPSYREGFPNVVMQAAAMQLNCIVTNINGCNEIIKNAENGWVIPVKNWELLKERMLWCVDNQAESKKMGLLSRNIMLRDFERKYVQNELLNEYQRLLK